MDSPSGDEQEKAPLCPSFIEKGEPGLSPLSTPNILSFLMDKMSLLGEQVGLHGIHT